MAKTLSNSRALLHRPTATVLSVSTPVLIGAAIRAVRRGADRADLAEMRKRLETVAAYDPAAGLVADWLQERIAATDRDPSSPRLVDRSLPRGEA